MGNWDAKAIFHANGGNKNKKLFLSVNPYLSLSLNKKFLKSVFIGFILVKLNDLLLQKMQL